MSDKQKIEAILNLLTDKTWLKLKREGRAFANEEEELGGITMLTHVFGKAYKIARA